MDDEATNSPATPHQIFGVSLMLAIILVPLFLIVVFNENWMVQTLFGGWRILGCWIAATILVIVFQTKIDMAVSNYVARKSEAEK